MKAVLLVALGALALVACSPAADRYDVQIQERAMIVPNLREPLTVTAAFTLDRRKGHVSVCRMSNGPWCADLAVRNAPKGGSWRFVPLTVTGGQFPNLRLVEEGDPSWLEVWAVHNPSGRVARYACNNAETNPPPHNALHCTAESDAGAVVRPPAP